MNTSGANPELEPAACAAPSRGTAPRRLARGFAILIGFAAVVAYWNTLSAPFFFDDGQSILRNATIRDLTDLRQVFSPPADGRAVTSRPIVNVSLAVNYALGGTDVRGYHLGNLFAHACTALALFGLLRHTFTSARLRHRFGTDAVALAGAIAVLWAVHPLLTESVTCVIQRTEVLVSLFYVLTLYCFVRSLQAPAHPAWQLLAVFACLLGMGTKEIMVSAPLIVLLYDRTFAAGTFAAAWRARKRLYLALFTSWLWLAYLVISAGGSRGTAAGFGHGMAWWSYALEQFAAVGHYLRLSAFPVGLTVDYGSVVVSNPFEVAPQMAVVAALLVGELIALRRHPAVGFAGAVAIAVLAPSSSIIPLVTQTVAEHRMYLPLAPLLALVGTSLYLLLNRRTAWIAAVAVALPFLLLTVRRNRDYRTDLSIWSDAARKQPANPRPHTNLGIAYEKRKETAKAMAHYDAALRLDPNEPHTLNRKAALLLELGQIPEAISIYERLVAQLPDFAEPHAKLASAYGRMQRSNEAIAEAKTAIELDPLLASARVELAVQLEQAARIADARREAEAALKALRDSGDGEPHHLDTGNALMVLGRFREALAAYQAAAAEQPANAMAHNNVGNALMRLQDFAGAAHAFGDAIHADPGSAVYHRNRGNALARLEQFDAAVAAYEAALRCDPAFAAAECDWADALVAKGDVPAAAFHYSRAITLNPAFTVARNNLALVLARGGEFAAALAQLDAAVGVKPDDPQLWFNYGNVLTRSGNPAQAVARYQRALALNPQLLPAYLNLAGAFVQLHQLEKAVDTYNAALRIDPHFEEARANLQKVQAYLAAPNGGR